MPVPESLRDDHELAASQVDVGARFVGEDFDGHRTGNDEQELVGVAMDLPMRRLHAVASEYSERATIEWCELVEVERI